LEDRWKRCAQSQGVDELIDTLEKETARTIGKLATEREAQQNNCRYAGPSCTQHPHHAAGGAARQLSAARIGQEIFFLTTPVKVFIFIYEQALMLPAD
jgi:hypothetical protein